MTDAQTWTLIAVFAGVFATMTGLVLRVVSSSIDAVRLEIAGLRGEMNAKFDALDRDVQALTRRAFGTDT